MEHQDGSTGPCGWHAHNAGLPPSGMQAVWEMKPSFNINRYLPAKPALKIIISDSDFECSYSDCIDIMPHGGTRFQQSWKHDQLFKDWVEEVSKDKYAAYCRLCKNTLDVRSMGRTALKSHAKGKKHKEAL